MQAHDENENQGDGNQGSQQSKHRGMFLLAFSNALTVFLFIVNLF